MTEFLTMANRAIGTLHTGISDSDLSVVLESGEGALFPSVYPYHISIEDEILEVTNRSTDTLTVTRGAQSTTPAAHSASVVVALNITAKSFTDLNTAVNNRSRNTTFVVAANDATTAEKDSADYLCDGTADEVQIIAAIEALPYSGGSIHLTAGTFHISSPIAITGNRYGFTISGIGYGTILYLDNNSNCNVITYGDAETTYPFSCVFSDFMINGNKANNTTGGYGIEHLGFQCLFQHIGIKNCKAGGIHIKDNAMIGSGNRYKNVWIYNCDNYGINGDSNVIDEYLEDVYVSTTTTAFNFVSGYNRFYNCEVDGVTTAIATTGILFVEGCRFYATQAISLSGANNYLQVVGNKFVQSDDTQPAISISMSAGEYSTRNIISSNYIENGLCAVEMTGDTYKVALVFVSNHITSTASSAVFGSSLTTIIAADPASFKISSNKGYDDVWVAKSVLTEQGDIIYASATSTPAALAHGTAGQFLQSGGHAANPSWATPSWSLISSFILTEAAASFDFSSIPATFNHLKVLVYGRCTKNATFDDLRLTFNNDSGTNYACERIEVSTTTVSGQQNLYSGAAFAWIGWFPAATATANYASYAEILIPMYAGTTFYKSISHNAGLIMSATTGNMFYTSGVSFWKDTSAINRITLVPAGGNFAAGSTCFIYGII